MEEIFIPISRYPGITLEMNHLVSSRYIESLIPILCGASIFRYWYHLCSFTWIYLNPIIITRLCLPVLTQIAIHIRQYIQWWTPIACYTTAPLYNKIIVFDTVITQKRNFKRKMMNSSVSPSCDCRLSQHHQGFCAARLHTSSTGNVKIARTEKSYYCYIHIMPTFRIVWLITVVTWVWVANCIDLRDDKNTAFV